MRSKALIICLSLLCLGLVLGSTTATASHDTLLGVFPEESFRIPYVPAADTLATDVELLDLEGYGGLDLFVTRGDLAGGARTNFLFPEDMFETYQQYKRIRDGENVRLSLEQQSRGTVTAIRLDRVGK